jgi:predicted RNA-binding protein YlxR (DUF448 family)
VKIHDATENGVSGPQAEQPERMCAGCRESAPKDELERFIFHDDAGLVFDLRRKAPGRGAYVHANPECIRNAVEKGGFSRGFKSRVVADPDELLTDVSRGVRRRLIEGLRVALQSQNMTVGSTAVSDAVRHDTVGLLLLASDSGESTRRKFESNADRKNIAVSEALTGEELGSLFGREYVAVCTVAPSLPLARIRQDIEKLAQLNAL